MSFKLGFKRVQRITGGGDCSNIEDRQQRMHDRQSESSSSAHGDQSSPMIVAVIRMRRNQSRCSNRTGTLEQLRERKTSRQSLYSMRNGTGSQWRTSWRSGVTWSYFLLLQMSLAHGDASRFVRTTIYASPCLLNNYIMLL